ncbi:hypothetical protein VF14_19640 [Nostoc linckia z18]|uniref:Uncharacterized protein n=2 Tax=Nostoc linckia TaxID=92942 RepID=A0A9Q5ZDG5_NOSLI|nr:hypothetical protein VF02_14965 [Nostoc linckia z1]PHJ68526.1 hypothetical protein VF05_15655 [Nostoc linckia z3]PHJ74295.1 hypothetical protein VF03_14790 [Nostoc linckia z2]PHJ80358.1 hypothetical protein VF06_23025 [Nostoc linckia z4]PHJ87832.1 hypothetical protein VF07_18770 [Nostoc linckia z6]PHJ98111.1 hypothetical protein VF04_10700 [Nostoc linckia z7]PHK04428.1 hypothetical protein VF08_11495 [Nostoc linckia z8]PHK04966.1 hypothetical protein VF09_27650 [Nostoc linckia z9]PHK1735
MQCSLGFRPRLIAGHQIFDFGGGLKPLLPLVAGRGQETEFPSAFCLLPSAFLVNRLLAKVEKRVRGNGSTSSPTGERANKNPFPFNMSPFPPLAKVTFARGLI